MEEFLVGSYPKVNRRKRTDDGLVGIFGSSTRRTTSNRVTINVLTHPRSAPVEIPSGPRVPPPGAGASPCPGQVRMVDIASEIRVNGWTTTARQGDVAVRARHSGERSPWLTVVA